MKLILSTISTELLNHFNGSLFKNSSLIILASISSAFFGFVFWILAAKLFSPQDVGIATALISSMALLVTISRFGLDFSIIRFFPENDKSRVFSTSINITTFLAILFGAIFIIGVDIFSPELYLLKHPFNALFYMIFLAANSIATLATFAFVAIRKADFYLIQSLLIGSRVIFIFIFTFFGAFGIFSAIGISFILAIIISLSFLKKSEIHLRPEFDKDFLNKAFHFSGGNYFAGLFIIAPNLILPIIVLNILGPEEAAYFYITFAMVSLLFIIPNAVGTSLFVEGSHGEALKKTTLKSLVIVFSILIPAAIILFFSGKWLLDIIGKSYSTNGLELLKIMIFASFFMAITSTYFSIKRIQKDIKRLVLLSGLIFVMLIVMSYIFLLNFGLVGIGYAWLVGYGLGCLVVGVDAKREGWI